ncbi:unnamed protein product [Enterobius vermicularis]|uniref:ANK_REP_REGION domain-containing protein n=1 Tax=Enterobius vermicularis TaxID=51028 RepID=A0A0N4USK3_ENTVE|nr:unnamed protein product [Enterobius vermicularis]
MRLPNALTDDYALFTTGLFRGCARNCAHPVTTSLHIAALNGHENLVEYLVDSEANICAKDETQKTPLHLASLGGHENIVKYLTDKGANVDEKYLGVRFSLLEN